MVLVLTSISSASSVTVIYLFCNNKCFHSFCSLAVIYIKKDLLDNLDVRMRSQGDAVEDIERFPFNIKRFHKRINQL